MKKKTKTKTGLPDFSVVFSETHRVVTENFFTFYSLVIRWHKKGFAVVSTENETK